MPNNPLTPQELLTFIQASAQQGQSTPQFPAKYVFATDPVNPGSLGLRLFDAAYISTGIIDPNRLGTGATGVGNLYLADDGTWKVISVGGGGDMLQATYDVDNDGTVDSAERIEIIVRNSTGTTLTKGTVVYLSGATGNRPNALRAQADTEATSSKTFGIVVANIANNSDGYVACNGTLHDLDTSAFADGDALWLSAATAGAYTSTIPAEPNHTVFIGYVARSHPTQGRLVILIQNGYELNELHGVLISSEANNDLLVYETSSTLWKNKSISTIFGGTPLVSVPTLAQVTTAGNTTTNAITVGSVNSNGNVVIGGASSSGAFQSYNGFYAFSFGTNVSAYNPNNNYTRIHMGASITYTDNFSGNFLWRSAGASVFEINNATINFWNTSSVIVTKHNASTGNFLIGTTTDAGYKLDVNGIARVVTRIDAGSFTPGAGATAYTFATTGQITASGGYNLRSPTAGDSTFSGLGDNSGPTIYNNNTTVVRFATVGGTLNGTNVDILQGYNPGAGTGTVVGFKHSYVLYPSADNTVSYTSFLSNPNWNSAPFYNRITGPIRGFYFANGLYNTQKLVDVIAFQSAGGRVLFEGELPSASAGISRGVYINQTHTAAANNDVLIGLDVNPTFTNGAFTGVTNLAARIQGNTEISRSGADTQLTVARGSGAGFTIQGKANSTSQSEGVNLYWTANTWLKFVLGSSVVANFSNVGNLLVGTSTDSGYKLDVNGTARISGALTINTSTLDAITFSNVGTSDSSYMRWLYNPDNTNNVKTFLYIHKTGLQNGSIYIAPTSQVGNATYAPTGNYNYVFGGGTSLTTGGTNVFIGRFAGTTVTTGSSNIFIGSGVGGSSVSTGSLNIGIAPEETLTGERNNVIYIGNIANGGVALDIDNAAVLGGMRINTLYVGAYKTTLPGSAYYSTNFTIASAGGSGTDIIGTSLTLAGGRGTGAGTPGNLIFSTAIVTTSGTTLQTLSERMRINGSGNVLINTTTDAGYKLDVNGTTRVNNIFYVTNSAYTGNLRIEAFANNQQRIVGAYGENITWGAGGNTMNLNATEVYVSNSFLGGSFWLQSSGAFCLGQQATANASSLLDIRSTTRGFLQPRMTNAQVVAIATPATGLQVYDTTNNKNLLYNGTAWQNIATETWVSAQGYLTTTPTLAQVTTAGNTTTNSITVGGLTINNNTINSQISVESNRGTGALVFVSANFRNTNATSNKVQFTLGGGTIASGESRTFSFGTDVTGAGVKDFFIYNGGTLNATLLITPNDNIRIGYTGTTYTDAGFRLDVNGSARISGNVTLNGRLQENLVFDTITGSIRTIEFKNVGGGLYPSVGGAARIKGEFGDFYWQAAGGTAMQLGAYHEIVLQGGRAVTTDLSFITGSSAAYNVRVLNTNASSVALAIQGVTSQTGDLLRIDSTSATSNGSTFVVKSNGNVLINTTTDAGYKLDVNGTFRAQGSITATLASTSTASVVYYNSSTGLLTYGTAPIGAQFVIDYDYNIVGLKNGVNLVFTTTANFQLTTTRVFLNGQRLTRGAGYDYVETGTNQITFTNAPNPTDLIIIEYQI